MSSPRMRGAQREPETREQETPAQFVRGRDALGDAATARTGVPLVDEAPLLRRFLAKPNDASIRGVYADWLEDRGDPRAEFLRAQAEVRELEPDHPDRLRREERLSRARLGLELDWLNRVEPERAHLASGRAECRCLGSRGPHLHDEPQDTECDAWKKVVEAIEQAARASLVEFDPLQGLTPAERLQLITLPPSIGRLTSVRRLRLYGSALVRLPAELGALSLEEFTPYTSYRLHWFPYELIRSGYRSSTVSTRALFGNYKFRPHFPRLGGARGPAVSRPCSVCRKDFDDRGEHRVWISLRVGTDVLPLLVNACSEACLASLPAPPEGYVATPHRGGPELRQPPRRG